MLGSGERAREIKEKNGNVRIKRSAIFRQRPTNLPAFERRGKFWKSLEGYID